MIFPERSRHYVSVTDDSARWDAIALRSDDIVVATPYKAGTTWTQYLCAMAVHGGPELPLPLSRLSPWIDTKLHETEVVRAALDAQPWRRVIKTHTPLDGVPYREDVFYVVTARDPRDAFLSMRDHHANFKPERRAALLRAAGLPENLKLPEDPDQLFRIWLTMPAQSWMKDGFPFGPYFHQLLSFWQFRELPNIHLMHYAELKSALPATFDRLTAFLRVELSPARRAAILNAANFDRMRDSAAALAPHAHEEVWKEPRDFFRSARAGAWREQLSPESRALYHTLSRERYPHDFLEWIESAPAARGAG